MPPASFAGGRDRLARGTCCLSSEFGPPRRVLVFAESSFTHQGGTAFPTWTNWSVTLPLEREASREGLGARRFADTQRPILLGVNVRTPVHVARRRDLEARPSPTATGHTASYGRVDGRAQSQLVEVHSGNVAPATALRDVLHALNIDWCGRSCGGSLRRRTRAAFSRW